MSQLKDALRKKLTIQKSLGHITPKQREQIVQDTANQIRMARRLAIQKARLSQKH